MGGGLPIGPRGCLGNPCKSGGKAVARVDAVALVEAGSIGRFEILPELAILTSDILGSDSSTTLVEKRPKSVRAATSVTRRKPHPAVKDGQ
jgi:hypothetical protein